MRSALVVVEVSLALVLLVGAGLMVGTFHRMLAFHPGFNPKNLLSMEIALPAAKYREDSQVTAFYDRLLRGMETIPACGRPERRGCKEAARSTWRDGRSPGPGSPSPPYGL